MRFLYAVPVVLACAFCGCKGGGEAAPDEGAETTQAECPKCDGGDEAAECSCETKAECPKCDGGDEAAECSCEAK